MMQTTLTEKQQQDILDEWNSRADAPPSLLELIRIAFPDDAFDGRSKEGRAVKDFLATRKIKARAAHQYKAKKKIELTEEHKEFVKNNAHTMSATEISRVIFANHELTPLHQEARCVNEYIKTLTIEPYEDPQNVPMSDYKAPGTFDRALSRANKYIYVSLEKNRMVPKQKKDIEALMGYLNTYRFVHQINSYTSQSNRDLFESSFVRYTYDKYDLAQEEVDQYIVLSTEVCIASDIQARVDRLQRLLDDVANDTEGRRISMSLVDAIGGSQQEYNQCVNRQNKLLNDLKEKRSDRMKKQLDASASILNLVEMWKEEENRVKLIKLANLRKQIVKDEIDHLADMDEVKSKILGLTEGEVMDG